MCTLLCYANQCHGMLPRYLSVRNRLTVTLPKTARAVDDAYLMGVSEKSLEH